MRVVFIEQESRMGGVEVTTLTTVLGLDRQRFTPVVVCPEPGELTARLAQAQIPVKLIARPKFYSVSTRLRGKLVPNPCAMLATTGSIWRASNRLAHFLSTQADLIVTKGLLAHFYGGIAAAQAQIPCVWHVQEVANQTHLGGFYTKILNTAARRWARLIIVDAQAVADQFTTDLHQAGKIRLLYNGVDIEHFSPIGPQAKLPMRVDNHHQPLIIGHVGRIVPLKGQHVLIEALAQLSQDWPNLHLIFVGAPLFDTDHYLRQLQQMVARYGLVDKVHFLGFRSDISEILRAIDIFVHPSIEADSPVSIQEAMAAGLPIIASGVPGTVELLNDGVNGYLAPPGDAAGLAEKLAFLLKRPAERDRLAIAARQTARQRYDRRVFVHEFERVLAEALPA